jgi:hypothetical protein
MPAAELPVHEGQRHDSVSIDIAFTTLIRLFPDYRHDGVEPAPSSIPPESEVREDDSGGRDR